jgi:type II restriction enzyme
MKLGFEETQRRYLSGSQSARAWTEQWVADWIYCPNCGESHVQQFPANLPVADFFCASCQEQYELKSQKKAFGTKLADGAFEPKHERLLSDTNPNLLLLNYDLGRKEVTNVCVVPKHFFIPEIIERRKPLAETARRAGWIGSNILLSHIPESGRIFYVRDSRPEPREAVLANWQRTLFLRDQKAEARGWLVEVMRCVEMIGRQDFTLEDVYAFENHLQSLYPDNRHVKPKIRQQLQVLRDNVYLEFASRGRYRLRTIG